MNWVQVQIEDNSIIYCEKCGEGLAQLMEVDIYALNTNTNKRPQIFVFLKNNSQSSEKLVLGDPFITNQKTLFLMFIQAIRCPTCSSEIGTYFKTVNVDNVFAMKRFALNLEAVRIKDNEQIILAMFDEALKFSMESLTKKQVNQQPQVSKLSKHSILKTINTIEDSYAELLRISQVEIKNKLKENIQKEKVENIYDLCKT